MWSATDPEGHVMQPRTGVAVKDNRAGEHGSGPLASGPVFWRCCQQSTRRAAGHSMLEHNPGEGMQGLLQLAFRTKLRAKDSDAGSYEENHPRASVGPQTRQITMMNIDAVWMFRTGKMRWWVCGRRSGGRVRDIRRGGARQNAAGIYVASGEDRGEKRWTYERKQNIQRRKTPGRTADHRTSECEKEVLSGFGSGS